MLSFMTSKFVPWEKHPQLSRERLSVIASLIQDIRHSTVLLHEPEAGDNNWSLGCRCYVRTCHALRNAAHTYDWLTIPSENGLCCTFAIGSIPFKFYRGEASDPPDGYLIQSWGEIHQQQLALELGLFLPDRILRLAIETDPQTHDVLRVTLVEMDEATNIIGTYVIPFDSADVQITSVLPQGVDLPPVPMEPLTATEEEENQNKNAGS